MSKPILAAMLSCSGTSLRDEEKYLYSAANPLGVTLFSRNLQNKMQILKLVDEIKNTINREDVLIAVDEEGGRVSRLQSIMSTNYVSAEILGQNPVDYTQMHADLIASEMQLLGLNVNYAPVIDKQTFPENLVLKGRCFSADSEKITRYATVMADTYIKNGICPCIKHLPTHFSAQNDPHLQAVQTNMPREKLEQETAYLQQFGEYPMAMTAHIILKSIDSKYPATMSKKVVSEFLRGYLNFSGLLVSDAIDMHALPGDIVNRAIASLDAGMDVICYCSGIYKDLWAICQEKRFMTEKSLIRFAKVKKVIHNTLKNMDINDIIKRYNQKFSGLEKVQYDYDATETLNKMLKKGENL